MGRFYRLNKMIKEDAQDLILNEIQDVDHVSRAWYNEDPAGLCIFADDEEYTAVMNRVVNICSREGSGAELSFAGYVQEDGTLLTF